MVGSSSCQNYEIWQGAKTYSTNKGKTRKLEMH